MGTSYSCNGCGFTTTDSDDLEAYCATCINLCLDCVDDCPHPKLAKHSDVESDMDALEGASHSPREFYHLVKTMYSALVFHENGDVYLE